jgi:hypothetical protein
MSSDRNKVIEAVAKYLMHTFETHKLHLSERGLSRDKPDFIAHQVIADLEEIYDEPFGYPCSTSVRIGYGGKQGIAVCRDIFADHFNRKKENNNANPSHNKMATEKKTNDLLQCVVSELCMYVKNKDELSSSFATLLGCKFRDDGQLIVALNERPVCSVDAEHFMCKLYITLSKTMSVRSSSKRPSCHKKGLHPIRHYRSRCYWDDENVRPIMLDIVETFQQCKQVGSIPVIHHTFLLPGET